MARTAGNVLLRLSDSLFLPLNASDYSETLRGFLQTAQLYFGVLLQYHNISLGTRAPLPKARGSLHLPAPPRAKMLTVPTGPLVTAVEKFERAAEALGQRISALQKGTFE